MLRIKSKKKREEAERHFQRNMDVRAAAIIVITNVLAAFRLPPFKAKCVLNTILESLDDVGTVEPYRGPFNWDEVTSPLPDPPSKKK